MYCPSASHKSSERSPKGKTPHNAIITINSETGSKKASARHAAFLFRVNVMLIPLGNRFAASFMEDYSMAVFETQGRRRFQPLQLYIRASRRFLRKASALLCQSWQVLSRVACVWKQYKERPFSMAVSIHFKFGVKICPAYAHSKPDIPKLKIFILKSFQFPCILNQLRGRMSIGEGFRR